ncbi:MAG: N-acetylmuramoyl-L-alanine amidase [Bacillota bacterium]|nr:N-acetylmuramoyl-L-alanine amidase [Bacillota bacterium]
MKIFILRSFRLKFPAFGIGALCIFSLIILWLYPNSAETKNLEAKEVLKNKIIAIDPGHGGRDPGAVGVSGVLEKDINLQLSRYLKNYLEKNGAEVILTRTKDEALGESKKEDLDARAEIVTAAKADIFISMQCNAIPDQSCRGAQIFYYPNSQKGQDLAEAIQRRFWNETEQIIKREAQTISAPYILKAVDIPAVIVEAGFLSNPEEEALLLDKEYCRKVAKAAFNGIVDYYRENASVFLFF